MKTTLNAIRKHSPCKSGWERLLRHVGKTKADDDPLPILTILESNGLSDALWAMRAVKGSDREIRLFAVWCARQVQHLMKDDRSSHALDVAERFANGSASEGEFAAAQAAALAAALAAASSASQAASAEDAAWAASRAAEWAASRAAASSAEWAAAWAAARAAASSAEWAASAEDAAQAASRAAEWAAASSASQAAASSAAWAAARAAQNQKLIEMCGEGE